MWVQLNVKMDYGNPAKALEALREIPADFDINKRWGPGRGPALVSACKYGYIEIVRSLLAHPGINVNAVDDDQETPFMVACAKNKFECAKLLINDPRTDLNKGSHGMSPLLTLFLNGRADIIRYWIASGREIQPVSPPGLEDTWETAAHRHPEIAKLLTDLENSPAETRDRVRRELGWHLHTATDWFALGIFAGDDYIVERPGAANHELARFVRIMMRLPMELQMILGNRVVGSTQDFITGEQRETGFRRLTRFLSFQGE